MLLDVIGYAAAILRNVLRDAGKLGGELAGHDSTTESAIHTRSRNC